VAPPVSAEPGTPIAGLARNGQHLDAFWVGYDGGVWTTWWDQNIDDAIWHPPFRLTAAAAVQLGAPLCSVARTDDHLDLFWTGQDGAVWSTWWDTHADNG
jgi:hypothetical protein